MTIVLDRVAPEDIGALWPHLEPFLAAACEAVNTCLTAQYFRDEALAGRRLVWTVADDGGAPLPLLAVFVTGERETPNGKTVFIDALGGWDREAWLPDCLAEFERHAKAAGAARIEIEGRMGWSRILPGYRPVRIVLEKDF